MFQILTAPPSSHARTQRMVESAVSSSVPCAIQTIRSSTLPVKGPRLFNILPKKLRNMSGWNTERFKCELDRYLATVPDEPLLPGLTQYRRYDSNSVIDWANSPYLHQQDNQLLQHNCLELDEAVTAWRPVGSHKHHRVIQSEWVILQPQWLRQKINQELEPTNTLTGELMGFVWRYILNCFIYLFIARNRPGSW